MSAIPVSIPDVAPLEWPRAERNDLSRLLLRRRELAAELADAGSELAASESEVQAALRRRSRAVVSAYALRREVRETEDALRALARKAGRAGRASRE
ncbi:MAG TPA: hypothetical protein VGW38_15760 [Chloroflexota bacterium]|nr:hypothetical protein [Chloroflexota bacterium]